jgi:hypothetical protein
MRPVEERDDVLEQFVARERLLEEGVGANVLGVRHILRRTPVADDENGDEAQLRLVADVLAELEAGLARQREVQTDEVRDVCGQVAHGTMVVRGRLDTEALPHERLSYQCLLGRVIFDEQYSPLGIDLHESHSPNSACSAAREHNRHGLQYELKVVRERPVVDVLHVEIHPLLEGNLIPATDLPDAR